MFIIESIGSGSSGNCYTVTDGQTKIMLEAGLKIDTIKKALNFNFRQLSALLVSHSHGDHSKSVKDMAWLGVNCYMSQTTANEIGMEGHRLKVFETKNAFKVGTLTILPFDLHHDVESHGFLIRSDNGSKLLFMTDSYYSTYTFPGVNYLMIECNYSTDILDANIQSGRVHSGMKKRLIRSHFSLENVLDFLQANDLSSVQEIWLLHLSNTNSDASLFKRKIQQITGKIVYIA